jgi:hypothetical protein
VLGFGGAARVVAPDSAVADFRALAEQTRALYTTEVSA